MRPREHFPADVLLDYLENQGDEGTMAQIRAHLEAGCAHCAEELAFWRRLLAALREGLPAEPSTEALERAIGMGERRDGSRCAPKPCSWNPAARRLEPGTAFREAVASCQFLFQAAGTDIDLLCEYHGTTWRITGQALSSQAAETGWTVAALSRHGHAATETDALGEFRLAHLPPGSYQLVLRGGGCTILLPEVRLPEQVA